MPITTVYQPVLSLADVMEPIEIAAPPPSTPLPPPPPEETGDVLGSGATILAGVGVSGTGTVSVTPYWRTPYSGLSLTGLPRMRRTR
jgi:hypothetical protein